MRTDRVMFFADVVWPDGVELPEQEMADLCAKIALGIAGHFQAVEEQYPDLLKGKVRVNFGTPMAPELFAKQLREE